DGSIVDGVRERVGSIDVRVRGVPDDRRAARWREAVAGRRRDRAQRTRARSRGDREGQAVAIRVAAREGDVEELVLEDRRRLRVRRWGIREDGRRKGQPE